MQRACSSIVAVLILAPALAWPAEDLIDGIAAQVGEDIILISEVMKMTASVETRIIDAGGTSVDIARLRANTLETLIEDRILDQQVERLDFFASDEDLDKALASIADENGLSVEQLLESVEAQGLPADEYKAEIKRKAERRRLLTAVVGAKVVIKEEEVRRLYDQRFSNQPEGGNQVHLRQLLVAVSEERNAVAACELARSAAQRIAAGEAFEAIASEISAVSPDSGGDIGWLHSDSLAPWMAKLVSELEPGEVSGVNEQPFGCLLLKLVERRAHERVTYEMAADRLFQEIYATKMEAEYKVWIEEIRSHLYIKRRGDFAEAALRSDTRTPYTP